MADAKARLAQLLRPPPPSMEVGFGAVFVLFGARRLARERAGWP